MKTAKEYQPLLNAQLEQLTTALSNGEPIEALVHLRAQQLDEVLIALWHSIIGNTDKLALIAVGGYGRSELHPHSDIDIAILVEPDELINWQTAIEQYVTQLWNLGLDIGHSVRTPQQCSEEASRDVTVLTNLLESRLLIGNQTLYQNMQQATSESHIWSKEEFFFAKLNEQQQRHQKFGDTAYKLEPNIKEGPGGLRDIQTIAWVAKRYFDANSLQALTALGFLTQTELNSLLQGRELLWRIRFLLHRLSKRREDRLLMDMQRQLANQLGYSDNNNNLAVEQFMQHYFRTVTELARLNEMLLQLLQEKIEFTDKNNSVIPINERFQTVNGYLEVSSAAVFRETPSALLELFLLMEQNRQLKGVRAASIRLVREHLYLIDDAFREQAEHCALFMAILKEPHGVSHELSRMNRYGVLAAYLPAFSHITGRMQFDLFHIYTVDEHTLNVLKNARSFAIPPSPEHHPQLQTIFKTLDAPEVLYVAALFHDIAKGRGGDHSELGADDAKEFCLRHGISKDNSRIVQWLVRNHLLMSMTAQRKDISDPDIILEFAEKVGDQRTLNYLYLLTVADITATNPELWTSWRDRLLMELYLRSKYVFRHGQAKPIDIAERVTERQDGAAELLEAIEIPRSACLRVWKEFGDDYFLRHNAEEIAWHTRAILEANHDQLPLVLINPHATRGTTPIFIYAQENDGFFAISTLVLSRLGLNIVDARIISSRNGYTLDTYMVLDNDNQPVRDQHRIQEIQKALSASIKDPRQTPKAIRKPLSRQLRQFNTPTRITTEPAPELAYSLLEIITLDRPGLLALIGQAFLDCNIRVHNAKISTVGERAENIFILSDATNRAIHDTPVSAQLIQTLHHHIDDIPKTGTA
ncbi:MAG: [protein-PII] uridylyltransferase [Gammaproteobacteria bacterium]|nr:[protein-PII] uridylyltransferase [Gammaproteobacteria bacterium]